MENKRNFTIERIISLLKSLDDKSLAKVDRLLRYYIAALKRKSKGEF